MKSYFGFHTARVPVILDTKSTKLEKMLVVRILDCRVMGNSRED